MLPDSERSEYRLTIVFPQIHSIFCPEVSYSIEERDNCKVNITYENYESSKANTCWEVSNVHYIKKIFTESPENVARYVKLNKERYCGTFIVKWVYWMERQHFWVNSGLFCIVFLLLLVSFCVRWKSMRGRRALIWLAGVFGWRVL